MDPMTSDPQNSFILGLVFGLFPLAILFALLTTIGLSNKEILIAMIAAGVFEYSVLIVLYLIGKKGSKPKP